MNWNGNTPMELLSNFSPDFLKENLETIQKVIDSDKYLCSTMLNKDLCGSYAPFCALCDKSMSFPCAVAYIRMKQADAMLEAAAANYEDNTDENNEISGSEAQPSPELPTIGDGNVDRIQQNAENCVCDNQQTTEVPQKTDVIAKEQPIDVEPAQIDGTVQEEPISENNSEPNIANDITTEKKNGIRIAIAKRKD